VKRLRAASLDEVAEVPGFGRRTAELVVAALHKSDAQPGGAEEGSPT
jgi:excinuclease ABC subunit C